MPASSRHSPRWQNARLILRGQADLDLQVRFGAALAGQHKSLFPVTRGKPWRIGPKGFYLALSWGEFAASAAPCIALMRKA